MFDTRQGARKCPYCGKKWSSRGGVHHGGWAPCRPCYLNIGDESEALLWVVNPSVAVRYVSETVGLPKEDAPCDS